MTIYLVQHGKSVPKEEDPDRPLSTVGIQEVEEIASRIKEYSFSLQSIHHTNILRALQTAEILQKYLNAPEGMVETKGMNPNDNVLLFAKDIYKTDHAMYVGHLPFMEKLVSYLVTGDDGKIIFKFQNAGIVKLQFSDDGKYWYISGALMPQPFHSQ
jgi:phosphohistidine phosphatase